MPEWHGCRRSIVDRSEALIELHITKADTKLHILKSLCNDGLMSVRPTKDKVDDDDDIHQQYGSLSLKTFEAYYRVVMQQLGKAFVAVKPSFLNDDTINDSLVQLADFVTLLKPMVQLTQSHNKAQILQACFRESTATQSTVSIFVSEIHLFSTTTHRRLGSKILPAILKLMPALTKMFRSHHSQVCND